MQMKVWRHARHASLLGQEDVLDGRNEDRREADDDDDCQAQGTDLFVKVAHLRKKRKNGRDELYTYRSIVKVCDKLEDVGHCKHTKQKTAGPGQHAENPHKQHSTATRQTTNSLLASPHLLLPDVGAAAEEDEERVGNHQHGDGEQGQADELDRLRTDGSLVRRPGVLRVHRKSSNGRGHRPQGRRHAQPGEERPLIRCTRRKRGRRERGTGVATTSLQCHSRAHNVHCKWFLLHQIKYRTYQSRSLALSEGEFSAALGIGLPRCGPASRRAGPLLAMS